MSSTEQVSFLNEMNFVLDNDNCENFFQNGVATGNNKLPTKAQHKLNHEIHVIGPVTNTLVRIILQHIHYVVFYADALERKMMAGILIICHRMDKEEQKVKKLLYPEKQPPPKAAIVQTKP